jgi:hypothetical protein
VVGGGVTERIGRRRLIGAIGIDMQRYLSYRFSWWWGCRIGLRRFFFGDSSFGLWPWWLWLCWSLALVAFALGALGIW